MKDGLIPVKFETFRKTLGKFDIRFLVVYSDLFCYASNFCDKQFTADQL